MSVSRLINEVLVAQLSIPFRQIVNDTTFSKYTGSKRPDILISEFEYDGTNDEQYIKIICVPTAPWATGPRLLPKCHFIFIFFVQILAPLLGRERILRHYVPQNDIYGRCSGKIEKISLSGIRIKPEPLFDRFPPAGLPCNASDITAERAPHYAAAQEAARSG